MATLVEEETQEDRAALTTLASLPPLLIFALGVGDEDSPAGVRGLLKDCKMLEGFDLTEFSQAFRKKLLDILRVHFSSSDPRFCENDSCFNAADDGQEFCGDCYTFEEDDEAPTNLRPLD